VSQLPTALKTGDPRESPRDSRIKRHKVVELGAGIHRIWLRAALLGMQMLRETFE